MKVRATASLVLLVAGCRIGADYTKPELEAPERFELAESEAALEANWWKQFGDATLDALVQRALASNFDLRLAALRLREARAIVTIAGGEARPQADVGGAFARREASTEVAFGQYFPPSANSFHSAGFSASWELDVFGRVARGVEAADAEYGMALEDARAALVVVCADVARNYVELRGFEAQIEVLRRDLEVQLDTATLVRSRVQAGLEDELALMRVDASLAQTRARLPELERDRAARQHALATLLGAWPRELVEMLERDAPPLAPPDSIAVGLPAQLLERRPDVRRAERELARASALSAQARAELYPRISLAAALGLESERLDDLFQRGARTWTFGPSITTPLLRGGLLEAGIEVRSAQQEQALLRLERAGLEALRDVETALAAWRRAAERRAELELALAASARAEELARERYTSGLESFLSVLDAQRERLATQSQLAAAVSERNAAAVAVYRALGGGWEVEGDAPALAAR
jgi:multidrug efflux system outer membrane protein